jgi:hypothetical protein
MAVARTRSRQLSQQIEALTRQLKPAFVVLQIPYALREHEQRVIQKHVELFPEDAGASQFMLVQLFSEGQMAIPDPDLYKGDEQPGDKLSEAWRSVAREMREGDPLAFWLPDGPPQ